MQIEEDERKYLLTLGTSTLDLTPGKSKPKPSSESKYKGRGGRKRENEIQVPDKPSQLRTNELLMVGIDSGVKLRIEPNPPPLPNSNFQKLNWNLYEFK
jgi:hypothetical protein